MREALGLALWDGTSYDTSRLPPSADPAVVAFFSASRVACNSASAGAVWFELISARSHLEYMLGSGEASYELFPSVTNFAATLASLLRVDVVAPPTQASRLPEHGF